MYKYLLIVLLLSTAASANEAGRLPWYSIKTPTESNPQVYGGYSAGCIAGAVAIPDKGKGYKLARKDRGRIYGHPQLKEFIEEYGKETKKNNLGSLMISDIGQPRGGVPHKSSNHLSHQNGLDVDIWYQRSKSGIKPYPHSVLTKGKDRLHPKWWNEGNAKVLEIASNFDNVERIFVHPAIKKGLCSKYKGQQWLNKIRPWWGHHQHFHVRLSCPKDSPYCKSQPPIKKSDGCDSSLDWWFSQDAKDSLKESAKKERPETILPEQCLLVYHDNT